MKRTIKLAVVAALALGATSAFATNGDIMIGQGAQSRAMGGVGIAKSFGAASSLANPALLTSVKNSEFTAGITAFMPDVQVQSDLGSLGGATSTYTDSDADLSYIPEIYYASRINKNLVYGITISGVAGMGTGYDDNVAGQSNVNRMTTELALMKIAVPFAYKTGALSLGITPVIQRGTLQISHTAPPGPFVNNGQAGDTSLGYELGVAYDVSSDLTLGAVYKSKIAMEYVNTIGASVNSFGGSAFAGVSSGDKLDQPAEYGLGVSYSFGGSTIAADYKHVDWEDASGYADFGWEDQDIFIIGYEYATKSWALRAGYNYAKSPIKEQTSGTAYQNSVKNFFNLSGFPGIVESHYTFGGGYNFSDALSMDVAVVYAAENKESFSIDTTGTPGGGFGTVAGDTIDVKHSQLGVTIAATYKF